MNLYNIEPNDAYVIITLVLGDSLTRKYQYPGTSFVRQYHDANQSNYRINSDILDILHFHSHKILLLQFSIWVYLLM